MLVLELKHMRATKLHNIWSYICYSVRVNGLWARDHDCM